MRAMWSIILPSVAVLLVLGAALMPYPWHASCRVKWEIPTSCEDFKGQLIAQMNAWEGDSLCPGTTSACPALPCGQNCLYKLATDEGLTVTATHQTPVARYTDHLKLILSPTDSGCFVTANSNSATWYAVLDFGTNYCNLRNLVDGAGISTLVGFKEETDDSVCT
eukprot:TRINITY_DN7316_c0_g1_i1.p1 TRINITY_DN7316_c0_g1~~TRINITY_DN7316_c0_g1_i1.p1  ORF type:complete len:165 (-),score=39.45 TRINITY_DN7316_c0_g1_i1:80-574(-)